MNTRSPIQNGGSHRDAIRNRPYATVHACLFAVNPPLHIPFQCLTRRSGELRRLIPPRGVIGYDVEVAVGLARFLQHQQRQEIRAMLQEHGIALSTGEISTLAIRFALHVQALHQSKVEDLRAALEKDGGYPLHVDATGEDGRGTLFVAYAGWKNWVLGAWRLPTENAEAIAPRLQEAVDAFGVPRAVVRDLGRAITGAVTSVFEQSLPTSPPIFACHLHLLRDIGNDLLEIEYGHLRTLFRNLGVRPKLSALVRDLGRRLGGQVQPLRMEVQHWAEQRDPLPTGAAGLAIIRALAQWVLDYPDAGQHRGFPFDRPYLDLYRRALLVCCISARLQSQTLSDPVVDPVLQHLYQILRPVEDEVAFGRVTRRLQIRCALFDELRTVLRLDRPPTAAESPHCDNCPPETPATLQQIERSFDVYECALRKRLAAPHLSRDERQACALIVRHLDRHGRYLWGHVLTSPDGRTVRLAARTNNVLEGFFHTVKHGERRRSGRKILTQDFEGLPAAAALVRNLTQPDYVAIVCDGKGLGQLADQFRVLDDSRPATTVSPTELTSPETAALPLSDRRLIRQPAFHERLLATSSLAQAATR